MLYDEVKRILLIRCGHIKQVTVAYSFFRKRILRNQLNSKKKGKDFQKEGLDLLSNIWKKECTGSVEEQKGAKNNAR